MTPRLRLQSITITPIRNDPNRFHSGLTFPPFERNAAHIIAIARHMESRINSIDLPGSIGLVDCVVNGQRARVWWVENQLDFVSRKLRKIITQHSSGSSRSANPKSVNAPS